MREYVYLFELDSVRKTDTEIAAGQTALYNEIVNNGNVVVMTYNQLVDSRGFFSLFGDKAYQKSLIQLFKNGAIRISQYGDVRSLSQYLINSVSNDKKFIYSALPVKYSQKHLLALIKRSLMYSDLSEIHEYCHEGIRSDEDLKALFQEVNESKEVQESYLFAENVKKWQIDHPESELPELQFIESQVLQTMREILKNIYWLLSTVLSLSVLHDIYIHPKDPSEYQELKMHNILDIVLQFADGKNFVDEMDRKLVEGPLWSKAVQVLRNLSCYEENNDNRSVYLREIKDAYEAEKMNTDKNCFQYAEAIINLCYNYACEISICNISKHYNIKELSSTYTGKRITFYKDFMCRLKQDWQDGKDADNRYLQEETTSFQTYIPEEKTLPNFEKAVHCTEYISYTESAKDKNIKNEISFKLQNTNKDDICRYEYNLESRKNSHKKAVRRSIRIKAGIALMGLVVACLVEGGFNLLQDRFNMMIDMLPNTMIPAVIVSAVGTILFLIMTEILTSVISRFWPGFMSLSDALGSMKMLLSDRIHMWSNKEDTYMNSCQNELDETEKKSKDMPIEFLLSPEMKRYLRYRKDAKHEELFAKSDLYPIATIDSIEEKKRLTRLEEKFDYHFGLVYQSRYNTLLVDPIEAGTSYFPYERVVPSSGKDGVVMLTKCKDNFIMLKQYRHAPRQYQYSFPRGFAEPDYTPAENACRELREELHAVITKTPLLLGRVISDSGLTSTQVYVFLAEIDSYMFDTTIHECIEEIIEIPESEMANWVGKNMTTDGFSLSAYALYESLT